MEFKIVAQSIEDDAYVVEYKNSFYFVNVVTESRPIENPVPYGFARFVELKDVETVSDEDKEKISKILKTYVE